MNLIWAGATFLALIFPRAGTAALFKYTDEKGSVHFVASESEIPEKFRKPPVTDSSAKSGELAGLGSSSRQPGSPRSFFSRLSAGTA